MHPGTLSATVLSVQDAAFVLIGLQTIRNGGDERVEPLFEKVYRNLEKRAPDVIEDLHAKGFIEKLPPRVLVNAERAVKRIKARLEGKPLNEPPHRRGRPRKKPNLQIVGG